MLTKLLKDNGKDKLKTAVIKTLTDEAVEPLSYCLECLRDERPTPAWQMSNDALMVAAEEKGLPTKGKSRQDLINALR